MHSAFCCQRLRRKGLRLRRKGLRTRVVISAQRSHTELAILSTSMGPMAEFSHTIRILCSPFNKITKEGVLKTTGKEWSLQKSVVKRKPHMG